MHTFSQNKQEFLNALSHALGILFGVIGLGFLLYKNREISDFSTLSIWIYGLSLIGLFTASTLYHAIVHDVRRAKARIFDHIGIFMLIAGTYTPICLISLEKTFGWVLFGVVWGIAGFGLILKLFYTGKQERLSLFLYLAMGWMMVVLFEELLIVLELQTLLWMAAGGFFYTTGTFFYAYEKIPYGHFIWHLFVLCGSISHYFMIYSII